MERKKDRLKPISFYGHKLEDVIRAFLQVDPKKLKEKEAGTTKYCVKEPKKEYDEKGD
jgi:hypothetical protein